jgi:hypothetical protein
MSASAATAAAAHPAHFLDGLTAVYLLDLLTKPLVFTVLILVLATTVFRAQTKAGLSRLAESVASFKLGDFSVEFQKLEQRVAVAESKADSVREDLDDLTVDRAEFDEQLAFDPQASAETLDEMASRVRSTANALTDTDSFEADLSPGSSEDKVFGAAIVARSQPKGQFALPLIGQIDYLAKDGHLRGFRLKVVYRLVMALETVLRTDNRLTRRRLSEDVRGRARATLGALAENPRSLEDDARNGPKGIGTRIRRTLALL